MTDTHTHQGDNADDQFDALLRDLGRDVPNPRLTAEQRSRLDPDTLPARPRHALHRATTIALAASLLLSTLTLGISLRRTTIALDTTRWEKDEAIELLTRARAGQPSVPVPDDTSSLALANLLFITFDHDLCPIAHATTPAFQALAAHYPSRSQQFLTLDVTGDNRDHAQTQLRSLGLEHTLLTPLGGETGVVKVIDTRTHRVLSSAPGTQGIRQAEAILAHAKPSTPPA